MANMFPTPVDIIDGNNLPKQVGVLPPPGQAASASSLPVVLASDQGAVPTVNANIGLQADAAVTSDSGTFSLIALFKRSLATLTSLLTANGTTADTAWASGSGSQIALLKTIATSSLDTTTPSPVKVTGNDSYKPVAASASATILGTTGAAGDRLSHVLIVPATTSPGAVSIQDGGGSAVTIFTGGATSVGSLVPFAIPLGIKATTAWKVTTGANVSVIGVGQFT